VKRIGTLRLSWSSAASSGGGGAGMPSLPNLPMQPPAPSNAGAGSDQAQAQAEPPNCTYERSVRKLPGGGGLQRVLIKVCPDA